MKYFCLSLVGGCSETVFSLNRHILWDLHALIWPWMPYAQPACPTWRSQLREFLHAHLSVYCLFTVLKSPPPPFRWQILRQIASLHSSKETLTSAGSTWMNPLSPTWTLTCCPCLEEPRPTASSTWPCRPASTTTSPRTSSISAWAPSEEQAVHAVAFKLSWRTFQGTLSCFIKSSFYYCIKSGVLCIVEFYESELDWETTRITCISYSQ